MFYQNEKDEKDNYEKDSYKRRLADSTAPSLLTAPYKSSSEQYDTYRTVS